MKQQRSKPSDKHPVPPEFVMWHDLPPGKDRDWERRWFGYELASEVAINIRGLGIREPMFNENVSRPLGTGDWLIMLFHDAPRLEADNASPSAAERTMMIWPPGAPQFYSWGKTALKERHSWMHVEGTSVLRRIEELQIPVAEPFQIEDESLMVSTLQALLEEMKHGERADAVILQNLFENWARNLGRHIHARDAMTAIPEPLLQVRRYLDANIGRMPPLDELAELAAMSRSHLCHRFRECFGTSISGYVIRKRMAAAQRMLFDVRLRPGDIADATGYADIYQFSKQFKKTFGVSPSQYRKNQQS